MSSKKVFLIAGEPSGDAHGAKLIHTMRKENPDTTFAGMGGLKMREAGMDVIVDSTQMAVVGFIEIIRIIIMIWRAFKVAKQYIREQKPDLVILIDYPGFNLRMAKFAKKQGCKVLYYISPQLWAWRQGRVKIIQRYVDKMAVILPFEVDFYREHNIIAQYVGHPLTADISSIPTKAEARRKYAIKEDQKIIGLCPGSRHSELKHLLPVMVATLERLRTIYPNCEFVVPISPNLRDEPFDVFDDDVIKVRGDFYSTVAMCDAVITASGTATLQIALAKTPMVIIYKSSWLSIQIAKLLVKTPMIGLCNLVAGKKIAKEFIQDDVTVDNLVDEVTRLIEDEQYRDNVLTEFDLMANRLKSEQHTEVGEMATELVSHPSI